jgi:hypothetical protein
VGVKIVTQLEHDQLPSLRLLASAIHAVAFFINVGGCSSTEMSTRNLWWDCLNNGGSDLGLTRRA